MKYFLTFYLIFIGSLLVNAQEIDDMYFTSTDRENKKKLSKKVSPAEVILSKYRKGNTKINSSEVIDKSILEKYKSSNDDNILFTEKRKDSQTLKFNRDNLYTSNEINQSFQDYKISTYVLPYMYRFNDPYNMYDPLTSMYYGMTSYDLMMLPRNQVGLRSFASINPMMFFSNPYLSSLDPSLSPALLNLHYPSIAGYGFGCTINKHGTWMFINNGTGGGLGHTLTNRHFYVSGVISNAERPGTRGGRSGRASVLNGENIPDRNYISRRQSGLTNSNISKDVQDRRGRGQTFANSQNTLFRDNNASSNVRGSSTRSSRSTMLNTQNRRSLSSSRSSSEKINNIMNYRNSVRSSYSGSTRGNSSFTASSDNGRRSSYTAVPNTRSSYSGSSVRNNSSMSRMSGGYFSGSSTGGGSYSGGGSSYSGGGSSSGGGVVSGGSSGGSSRGGGRN